MIRRASFWAASLVIGYTYLGYPMILLLRAWLWPKRWRAGEGYPSVSFLVAAYNEEEHITAKIENALALEYAHDRLEVVVVSDGSTDRTNELVAGYSDRGIRLLALPRSGKAAALNRAVAQVSGDILVFSDANSIYEPQSLRRLVAAFVDPEVGGVAGNQRYLRGDSGTGERWYWNIDRWLKEMESSAGSTVAATGAIYAIRRSLFRPIPDGVNDDFVTSTSVVQQGYRLVFARDAVAWEPVSPSTRAEFRRKVRLMSRALRSELAMRQLFNPFHYGFYAIQLASHKTLRRLLFLPLSVIALVSPFLWRHGSVYRLAAVLQVVGYSAGILGLATGSRSWTGNRLLALPGYFILGNGAAAVAAWNLVRGVRIDQWEAYPSRAGDRPTATQP